jgi:ABC-2 type transport system ATP-binding protein
LFGVFALEVEMPGSEKEYGYWRKRAGTHDDAVLYIVGPTIPQEIRSWLMNQFEDTDMVLEMGCGAGFFSKTIAVMVGHLTATDLAPEMVEQAERKLSRYSNVEVQVEDCYVTSFADNMFDAVSMVNLLHIVKEPVMVLEESRRVLKDDGRVVVADYTGYGMPFLSKLGLGFRYMKKWRSPPPYNKSFSPDELTQIVKEAGFVVEESTLIGKHTKAVCLRGKKAR